MTFFVFKKVRSDNFILSKLLLVSIILFSFSCKEETLFKKIDPSVSNINFANRITETDSMNIINFEYIYNGAGVGVGDFNNDGKQDLFFTGNQVESKLYLNKGNFKFEDVTKKAALDMKNRWVAGAVTVDINADGLLDIYVACTVRKNEKDRENLLFVNQGLKDGIPSFKEMSVEYGVNDNGHSESAAFFDYDNDGDLDLYVLTNIIDQFPSQIRPKKLDGTHPNTDRLYRCDWTKGAAHPVYSNVSKEAGIIIEGHGLGLNICDINKDGYKDIYVTNDYISDELLYINNKNGTFTDQASKYFKHTSNSSMGNDIADINNDGFLDIITMDMLSKTNERKKRLGGANNNQLLLFTEEQGYNYQYMRNTLQLNNGIDIDNAPKFSEISLLAGVAETDWSWAPSLADFDLDGYKDLLITNGFPKDVTDRDFMNYRLEVERLVSQKELLPQIPVIKLSNFAFKNMGNLKFEDVTDKWGLNEPTFSSGAVYADLDNDGDLDYIVNNINDSSFVYQNNAINKEDTQKNFLKVNFEGDKYNTKGVGTTLLVKFEDGEVQIHENNPYRGYLSTVELGVHVGIGQKKVSSIEIWWYNGKKQIINKPKLNTAIHVKIGNATEAISFEGKKSENVFSEMAFETPPYIHEEVDFIDFNVQNLLPFKLSQLGPGVSAGDVNGDGLEDLFFPGGYSKSSHILIKKPNGGYEKKVIVEGHEDKMEHLSGLFVDLDLDRDLDLYVCVGGNERSRNQKELIDLVYVNDGKGNFSKATSGVPRINESSSCVRAFDYDNDNDLDLIVAGRNVPNKYPMFANSHLLRNDSKAGIIKLTEVSNSAWPDLKGLGLVCDLLCTDFDGDNQTDIIVASEWAPIRTFKNNNGKFQEIKDNGLKGFSGLWNSINGADMDHDGDIDYVVGNLGENALLKGTEKYPVTVLAKDFDNNGIYDLIPFMYFKNEKNKYVNVPYNSKDDVHKMVNYTRTMFISYNDFATATIDNVLKKADLEGAQKLYLNYNSSVFLNNLGNGKFEIKVLPVEAQFSALNGILMQDFDADGHPDILIVGNNYGNEVSMGRYDASNGLFLKGNGKGDFKSSKNSGFYAEQDTKAMVLSLNANREVEIIVSQNRGPAKFFKTTLSSQEVPDKLKKGYTYTFKGFKNKQELYYGSGYLSQSLYRCFYPKGAAEIQIF